ncbi:MAG: ribosome biogenesis GTPase Der [Candidatus Omnitrophota bacterium]
MKHIDFTNLPKVAIIGRPNVGKSSLFNRMLKSRKAITEQVSGVTRDRLYAKVCFDGVDFILIDTGGLMSKPKEKIARLVYEQSSEAIKESDAIIFVCDVTSGISYQDEHVASILKKSGKKTFLVVNKVDSDKLISESFIFYKLGLGQPHAISALHGRNTDELYKHVVEYISTRKGPDARVREQGKEGAQAADEEIKIAIVGRPNVGKSSFINCILNQDRLLVDEVPGTTRDSIDVFFKKDNTTIVLIDTAGMRHKKKIKETVEMFSLARTKQSVKRCDVALIMIDGRLGLSRDDMAVIDYVLKQGKGCALLVNKRDLIKDTDADQYKKELIRRFNSIGWIHIIFTSCKEKRNIIKAVDTACEILKRSKMVVDTPRINNLIESAQQLKAPPSSGRIRPRIYYATQIGAQPPKFLFFCSNPKRIKPEYLRFVENHFRKNLGLIGVPIFFELREK